MDRLRLAVACTFDEDLVAHPGTYSVEVFVNDLELTSRAAGLGMDPYDLLVPRDPDADDTPNQVPFARCRCGVYGCDLTDVVITRDGKLVHWDWEGHAPLERRVTFAFDQYQAEIRRAEADHDWEPPDRTAGRLILDRLSDRTLPDGFSAEQFSNNWGGDDATFLVGLRFEDTHQIFVAFPWGDQDPATLADRVVTTLTERPVEEWTARWSESRPGVGAPWVAPPTWTGWHPSQGRPF